MQVARASDVFCKDSFKTGFLAMVLGRSTIALGLGTTVGARPVLELETQTVTKPSASSGRRMAD